MEELNVNVTEELVGEYRRVPVTLLPRRTHRQNKQTKHCGGGAFEHSVNRVTAPKKYDLCRRTTRIAYMGIRY